MNRKEALAMLDEGLTVNVPNAARVLDVGRNQCYEAVKNGEIPSIKIGKRIVVPVSWLRQKLGLDHAP